MGAHPDYNDVLQAGGAEALRRTLDEACARAEQQAKARATGFSAAELQRMEFPPIKYVVPGYIAEGLTLLAGRPKLGKSWMAMDMALAVAFGGMAFGSIECVPGDVLYLALEDNPRRLQKRMRQLLPSRSSWPPRLRIDTKWQKLDQGGFDRVAEWCAGVPGPRLVIIDTLQKVRRSRSDSDNSYEADYRAVEELQGLAADLGLAIVLVHHVRKMDADDPLDTVSGTTGLTGAVDSVLVLKRDISGVVLYGRGRDIEEIETAVEFDRETGRWRVLGAAAEVRISEERRAILDAVRDNDGPMSPKEIADLTGLSYDVVRQLVLKLARDGALVKVGTGKYAVHSIHTVHSPRDSATDD